MTRQDEDGKSPMKLLVTESNTYIRQRWAARVMKRAAVNNLCNKLCDNLRGDPGQCDQAMAEAHRDVAAMRAKMPAKLDGSWINHATHRWTKRLPPPAAPSVGSPARGTLVYTWKREHRPDTVHRYVDAKQSPAPPNATYTDVCCFGHTL